jgi:squalene-hopene/tetraprenyl-beta-curcumene cyclase
MHRFVVLRVLPALALLAVSTGLLAEEKAGPDAAALQKIVARGAQFLANTGQASDGSFSKQASPGVSSLCTAALLHSGRDADDPAVARSLKYLESFVQPDGGIYQARSLYANYETCLAMVAFSAANKDGRYNELIKNAEKFVKGLQWDEGESHDKASVNYGGAGYGNSKRPDLSNTSFLIDALRSIGAGEEDPAIQKALVFVSRCQNLESAHNTTEFAAKNPDGGFYYTIAAGGSSQAGKTDDGGLRSYGSMTYAGLKSMIYAGVGPDDPRVKAALEWIGKHYDLQANPGMGDAGLYYYYHTFAKALAALDQSTFTDSAGAQHDWRKELVEELGRRQRADGAWLNENSRWLEGDANLVTAYALLALNYCQPK